MYVEPVKTYIELSKVIKFLDDTTVSHNINFSENLILCVGVRSAGIDIEELDNYKHRTNHYLQEALGTKQLPSYTSVSKELVDVASVNKLLAAIKKPGLEQKNINLNFYESVEHITEAVLQVLREREIIKGKDKYFTEVQKQELDEKGFLIIPSVLSAEEVEKLRDLTLFIAKEEEQAGVSYRYGGVSNSLQRIYNLISKHPVYVELLERPLVKEVLEHYFARDNLHHKYVLSSFQSNIIYPGGKAQQLHVDGWSFSGVPLPKWSTRLNVNYLLTDWTENNGATMLKPGSHKLFRCPAPGEISDSELTKVIAPKGSLALWTGHTWHKSGTNNSGHPRFGLFACFAASQLKEVSTEEEHILVVDEHVKNNLSPEMKFMIGVGRGVKMGALHRVDFEGTKFNNLVL